MQVDYPFVSTKTYGHNAGLSCCFRQWRADSHCNLLHGYALSFKFVFCAKTLDDRNWVMDFGGLKELKKYLEVMFDHTLVVASDDPQRSHLASLDSLGLADVRELPNVGCEAFAQHALEWVASNILSDQNRVKIQYVEVREHEGNSAIYFNPNI